MKQARAVEVAELLSKTDEWHSHGRGISMEVLRKKAKLRFGETGVSVCVDDFGEDEKLDILLKAYHRLLTDYIGRIGANVAIHVCQRFKSF